MERKCDMVWVASHGGASYEVIDSAVFCKVRGAPGERKSGRNSCN